MRLTLLPIGLLLATACGLVESEVGCDFREDGEARCQSRIGLPTGHEAFKGLCETSEGTAVDDGCDTSEAVAGCYYDGPAEDVIDWYYAPETAESIQQHCDDDGYEYITP